MNPEQLWETTMDPAARTLLESQPRRRDGSRSDLLDADGRRRVEPRKDFIDENAGYVRNLDI
ncbi:MAG: hypothetical protein MZU97_10205 [Bacillus subtilis]|nr:hypothetical protein [Bacillus subtilis]